MGENKANKLWEAFNDGMDAGTQFKHKDLTDLALLKHEDITVKQAVSAFTRKRCNEGLINVYGKEGKQTIWVKLKPPDVSIEAQLVGPTDLQFLAELIRRMKALITENKELKKIKGNKNTASEVERLTAINLSYRRNIEQLRKDFNNKQRELLAKTAEFINYKKRVMSA